MDRFIEVEGARLHVRIEGEGTPVLIPTGAGFRFYENTFSPNLKVAIQRIYIEMRGTGESTGDIVGATFSSLADDVEAVCRILGQPRPIVLGHSNHGCIATEFALRHPGSTLGTVSVASCADFSRAFPLGQERWAREAPAEAQKSLAAALAAFEASPPTDADQAMLARYIAMAPLGWRKPGFDHEAVWGAVPRGMAAYLGWLFESGSDWDATARLPELKVPLLAVCGSYDYLCPHELWGEPSVAPNVEKVVFENSAHNPQAEEPERFDAVVLDFIERVAGNRPAA